MPRALAPLLIAALLLGGCIPRRGDAPFRLGPATPSLRQCLARLDEARIRYTRLPDRDYGRGCLVRDAVQLRAVGPQVTSLGATTCATAAAFVDWLQSDLTVPAVGEFGSPVARIETFGTFACRNVNNAAHGRLSEHAFANAVDVSGFVLANGRRITVLQGWHGDPREQRFLRSVRAGACRRFRTVLSPDYNSLHANHLHLDMGGARLCR